MAKSLRSKSKRKIRAARRVKAQPKVNQQLIEMLAASKAIEEEKELNQPKDEEQMVTEEEVKSSGNTMEIENEGSSTKSSKVKIEKLVPFMSQRKLRKYQKSVSKKGKKKRKGIQW